MIGTSTPRPRTLRTISGTAAAASSVLTVTRTSSEPACASRATWIAVESGSAVSVLVIDWTTTGWRAADEDATDIDGDGRPVGEVAGIDGCGHGVAGTPPKARARSNPETQMMNANRNTNPTT